MWIGTLLLALLGVAAAVGLKPERDSAEYRTQPPTVRIEREGGRYVYLVNGVEKVVRGMGYNVLYVQRGLSPEERERRLRADFELLRAIGVNTIQSWQEPEVDQVHLDLAVAYDLDVILYYHLPRGQNYADSKVRDLHARQMRAWMLRWRGHPAITMWGIGNETLLGADCSTAKPFLEFYVQLFQDARNIDPTRPVVYREAEDVMVPCLREAFAKRRHPPDQFIYGSNFYGLRLGERLTAWPEFGFDVPVLVSEFAPVGVSPSERPELFAQLWHTIEQHSHRVIGGAPYTWTVGGPEATDRIFGLVDDNNHPVDRSLVALSEVWGGSYGKPRATEVEVPDLGGMTLAQARAVLFGAGLDLELVNPEENDEPASDLIQGQIPEPGVIVEPGFSVQVVASVPDQSGAFDGVAARIRDLVVQATGEPDASFEARLSEAIVAVAAKLAQEAPDAEFDGKAYQLVYWRAWVELLAQTTRAGKPLFPGAENIVPVYAGLTRFALVDAAAFEQAEPFAVAIIREWTDLVAPEAR